MAGRDPDDNDDEQSPLPAPWYNRTRTVVGASVAGLAVIGILIAAVTFVSRQLDDPVRAPLNFVEPTFSASPESSSTPTTTATITSTRPPITTDINTPASPPPSSDTSSSDTSTSTRITQSRPRHGDESAPRTTRRGPRTNVTRTLYPPP